MGAKAGQRKQPPRRSAGRQRLWLLVFGVLLVGLFVVFAVAQGIGATSVPSGDAAIVENTPTGKATVSEAEVKRATGQQIIAAVSEKKVKKAPKPGSKKFEELRESALGELLDQVWIVGEAEELGITVTDKQIESELATIKKTNFPTPKAYKEFLEKSHFTQEDVNDRVKLQILTTEIQEQISSRAGQPSADEISNYYETEKATQFTTPASRDVRVVVNEDKAKVDAAKKLLEGNQSAKTWEEAASKYSSDPTTKTTGGLQKAVTEEFVKGELKKAIFDNATGELVGPVKFEKNYLLIEPVKINAEKVKTLAEVKSQISQTLAQELQQNFFSEFVTQFQGKWTQRTTCASGYLNERCSNFKGSGHPANASPACYEAEPKKPPKECPAPVIQNTPALPGSVSKLKPQGDRLAQRPRPEGLEETTAPATGAEAITPEQAAAEAAAQAGE